MSAQKQNRKSGDTDALSLTSALSDSFVCGVLVVESEKIASCNPEAARILRLEPVPTPGTSTSKLPSKIQKLLGSVAETGQAVSDRTIGLPADNGEVALHITAIPTTIQGANQIVVVVNDISIARQLEQHMRRLDRLASIGTLSASTGHEIKNALVAIKTFVDLLVEKNRDMELNNVVKREMRRIDALVGQMLKFAAPARPNLSAVRLHEILDHSLRMVHHQLEAKAISVKRSFRASPDSIEGDSYQLEQAFVNLFLNAIEAMSENGRLTVITDLADNVPSAQDQETQTHVRVVVQDTGTGVAPENLDRLFEPFFTTKSHGTGLGLPITRQIFREHNGDITVASQLNVGTTFSILLPASAHAR